MEKKTNNSSLAIGGILAAIGAALVVIVKFAAPVCAGMVETAAGKEVPMRCHYASAALVFLGILLLVNGILCMIKKEKFVCGVMAVVISILVYATFSTGIGMGICANPDMACNVTAPFAKVCAAAGIVTGLASAFIGKKEK